MKVSNATSKRRKPRFTAGGRPTKSKHYDDIWTATIDEKGAVMPWISCVSIHRSSREEVTMVRDLILKAMNK